MTKKDILLLVRENLKIILRCDIKSDVRGIRTRGVVTPPYFFLKFNLKISPSPSESNLPMTLGNVMIYTFHCLLYVV